MPLVLALVFAIFVAGCGDDSSTSSDPASESQSSSSVTLSEVEGSSSSVGRETSSSSVKSGDDSQKSSSSVSGKNSSSDGVDTSSSSVDNTRSSSSGYVLRDSLCSSDYEGWTQYIPQLQQEFICENGRWIPMSSSSVTPSSSSKYYDMSRLFVSENDYSYGEFTDPRDGQVYKTIRYEHGFRGIDSITFFAQNLNYGRMIPGGTQMTDSTKFCYDDDPWYCENGFGGLYTWATVMNFPAACDSFAMGSAKCPEEYDLMSNPVPEYQNNLSLVIHRGICPEGWHVMNEEEWATVMKGRGSRDGASYLGAVLWGSNQRGFSLLPAGVLQTQWVDSPEKYIRYANIDVFADHWIPGDYDGSLVRDSTASYGNTVLITQDRINRTAGTKKVNGLSIRCVQDY
ncbi:FISUMP domain-containing protein [Fibrobacter sp.]|uniref:FISUMP domain-containing protein n=1 Tax=Fibrobacter sp. TaxID=35828 RepID=UPI00386551B6